MNEGGSRGGRGGSEDRRSDRGEEGDARTGYLKVMEETEVISSVTSNGRKSMPSAQLLLDLDRVATAPNRCRGACIETLDRYRGFTRNSTITP